MEWGIDNEPPDVMAPPALKLDDENVALAVAHVRKSRYTKRKFTGTTASCDPAQVIKPRTQQPDLFLVLDAAHSSRSPGRSPERVEPPSIQSIHADESSFSSQYDLIAAANGITPYRSVTSAVDGCVHHVYAAPPRVYKNVTCALSVHFCHFHPCFSSVFHPRVGLVF